MIGRFRQYWRSATGAEPPVEMASVIDVTHSYIEASRDNEIDIDILGMANISAEGKVRPDNLNRASLGNYATRRRTQGHFGP